MILVKEGDKNLFFVEINNPEDLRRGILEVIKDIIENLQRFEKFKSIRKVKSDRIKKLKKEILDIHKLFLGLRHSLPETRIKPENSFDQTEKEELVEKKRKKSARREEPKERPLSELEKLQSDLSSIERKLESLK